MCFLRSLPEFLLAKGEGMGNTECRNTFKPTIEELSQAFLLTLTTSVVVSSFSFGTWSDWSSGALWKQASRHTNLKLACLMVGGDENKGSCWSPQEEQALAKHKF